MMEIKTKRQHCSEHNYISAGQLLFDMSTSRSMVGSDDEANDLQFKCLGRVVKDPQGLALTVDLDQIFSVNPNEIKNCNDILSCNWSLNVRVVIKSGDKAVLETSGENEGGITEFQGTPNTRRNICHLILGRGGSYFSRLEPGSISRNSDLKLTLKAELEVIQKIQDPRQNVKMIHNSRPNGLDLLQLLIKDYSDVTIKCGSEDIKAHKIVLTSCSPVFARMLDSPMDESITSVININDFEPETIQNMVTFMYEGTLNAASKDSIVALLDCAEKYDIADLKVGVVKKMLSIISPDNAAEFAAAVTKFRGDERSKRAIFDYCKANFSKLTANSHFRQFFKDNVQFFL